jgi:hypothetical protein
MGFRSKPVGPVDRAVEDIERQIKTLERQIHQLDATGSGEVEKTPLDNITQYIREALSPPKKRKTTAPPRERYDLFDLPAAPLQELQVDNVGAIYHEPPGTAATVTRPAGKTGDRKLATFLGAGTFHGQKPVLKHVQRKNQKRFYMWMGLALAVLCLFYFIVR